MLTPQEEGLIKWNIENGRTREEAKQALANFRAGIKKRPVELTVEPELTPEITPELTFMEKGASLSAGAVKGAIEGTVETTDLIQKLGQRILSIGPGTYDEIREQTGFKSLSDEGVKELLKAKNEYERGGKIGGFVAEVLVGGGAGLLKKGFQKGTKLLSGGVDAVFGGADELVESVSGSGAFQKTKELTERIPRFLGKAKESVQEAAEKAVQIKKSTPAVQEAYKVGLDEGYIITAQQADQPTLKAYKEMVDIASDTKAKPFGSKLTPETVGGRFGEEQYNLITKERSRIGKAIGEASDALPDSTIFMRPSFSQIEAVLAENGMTIYRKGGKNLIDFTQTNLTPQQRTKVQELYNLAMEGGDELSAKVVHGKDQLFATLKRESSIERIKNVFVKVGDENVNIYDMFRDVYRNQLDNLSPEIRELNGQYRKAMALVNDMEKSIVSTGRLEATKGVSEAEFIKTNLRRILGEAKSTPEFQAVVNQMDDVARQLGYVGPRIDDLASFAQELRKLYPEVIPSGGFTGGIRTGIADIAERVLRAGTPDIADKQKALKAMLEELLKNQ